MSLPRHPLGIVLPILAFLVIRFESIYPKNRTIKHVKNNNKEKCVTIDLPVNSTLAPNGIPSRIFLVLSARSANNGEARCPVIADNDITAERIIDLFNISFIKVFGLKITYCQLRFHSKLLIRSYG